MCAAECRLGDVGKFKAAVAAERIMARFASTRVDYHCCKMEDMSGDFYAGFDFILCGLDSVDARRWINATVVSIWRAKCGAGDPDAFSGPVLIDGGSEGYMGHVRLIVPHLTACTECTLSLYTPRTAFPLCTLQSSPRLPEHCVHWALLVGWDARFGSNRSVADAAFDADNAEHAETLYRMAADRASEVGIRGVDRKLVDSVIKHTVPAIPMTNGITAALMLGKMDTIRRLGMSKSSFSASARSDEHWDSLLYNGSDGFFVHKYRAEILDDCTVCGLQRTRLAIGRSATLADFIRVLQRDHCLSNPSVRTAEKTLFMPNPHSLRVLTNPNLDLPLFDQVCGSGDTAASCHLFVTDSTAPHSFVFTVTFK